MAVENLKSAAITNSTATPIVKTNSAIGGGLLKGATGSITPSATASIASTYKLCRVPSNCRISQLLLSNAAFTTGAMDVGVYDTDENGAAVISAAFFGSAVDMTAANVNKDITNESGTYTVLLQEKMLWQALGLSADPCKEYDIVATVTTAFVAGVAFNLKVQYAI